MLCRVLEAILVEAVEGEGDGARFLEENLILY